MEKSEIIIYVSGRNNYNMLDGEVMKNIDFDGYEFVAVDDASEIDEVHLGTTLAKKYGFTFLQNEGRGVQMATQTLINWINENRPDCKWIVCFQHDTYPMTEGFFEKLAVRIREGKLDDFGFLGFNILDSGPSYCPGTVEAWQRGDDPIGIIGLCHLSIQNNRQRWLCPARQGELLSAKDKWNKPFQIELPLWCTVGINVAKWNEVIKPTEDYHFHLWFPDVAMQFNYNNIPGLILPDLYVRTAQELKTKYNINRNSATGARDGDSKHFGDYSNFEAWTERWGWDYENVGSTFPVVRSAYEGTLIAKYFDHNMNTGPFLVHKSI